MSVLAASAAAYAASRDACAVASAPAEHWRGLLSLAMGSGTRAVTEVAEYAELSAVASAVAAHNAASAAFAAMAKAEQAIAMEEWRQRSAPLRSGAPHTRAMERGNERRLDFSAEYWRQKDAEELDRLKRELAERQRACSQAIAAAGAAWDAASEAIWSSPGGVKAAQTGVAYTNDTMRGWCVVLGERDGKPVWYWSADAEKAAPLSEASAAEMAYPVLYALHPSAPERALPKHLRHVRALSSL